MDDPDAIPHSGAAHAVSAPAPAGLAATLDAYLALHDALASDDLGAATASAHSFETAFAAMTADAPDDDPHLWHRHHEHVTTIEKAAASLAAAASLDEARVAFGALSFALADLVDSTGVPEGYDLTRHVCGMTDAPGGGVWLQRDGAGRNPYFGTAMLACGRPTGDVPEASMEMRTDALHPDGMPMPPHDH